MSTPRIMLMALACGMLTACATRYSAPVIDRAPVAARPAAKPAAAKPPAAMAPPPAATRAADGYTVKRGDTLYSIALDHGVDYRELAQWNSLDNPNVIREGQSLRLRAPDAAEAGGVQVRPIAAAGSVESRPLGAAKGAPAPAARSEAPKPQAAKPAPGAIVSEPRAVKLPYSAENLALLSREAQPAAPTPAAEAAPQAQRSAKPEADEDEGVDWGWPTAGRVSAGFSENTNKGIDIGGKHGQPVLASASGTVSYAGSGIRGYGKFVVVRHNKAYLSVYAHNDSLLVKEGQRVVKGQKIAEMGNSDTDQVKLHFEIRRMGKPIDPAKFLPER